MEKLRQQSDLTDVRKMDRKIDTSDTRLNKKMDELGGNIRWLGKIVIGAARASSRS